MTTNDTEINPEELAELDRLADGEPGWLLDPEGGEYVAPLHPTYLFPDMKAFLRWLQVMHPPHVWSPSEAPIPSCWAQHPRTVQLVAWAWASLEAAAAKDSELTTVEGVDGQPQIVPTGGGAIADWWAGTARILIADIFKAEEECDHPRDDEDPTTEIPWPTT